MKVNEEAKDRRGNNNSKKAKKKRQQLTRGREGDIARAIDALFSLHVSLPSCAFLSFFPFSHSLSSFLADAVFHAVLFSFVQPLVDVGCACPRGGDRELLWCVYVCWVAPPPKRWRWSHTRVMHLHVYEASKVGRVRAHTHTHAHKEGKLNQAQRATITITMKPRATNGKGK